MREDFRPKKDVGEEKYLTSLLLGKKSILPVVREVKYMITFNKGRGVNSKSIKMVSLI